MRTNVMTPDHPRWNEFFDALSRAVICDGSTRNARHLLESMGGFDVGASLEALRHLNGRCDCEIVFQIGGLQSA